MAARLMFLGGQGNASRSTRSGCHPERAPYHRAVGCLLSSFASPSSRGGMLRAVPACRLRASVAWCAADRTNVLSVECEHIGRQGAGGRRRVVRHTFRTGGQFRRQRLRTVTGQRDAGAFSLVRGVGGVRNGRHGLGARGVKERGPSGRWSAGRRACAVFTRCCAVIAHGHKGWGFARECALT